MAISCQTKRKNFWRFQPLSFLECHDRCDLFQKSSYILTKSQKYEKVSTLFWRYIVISKFVGIFFGLLKICELYCCYCHQYISICFMYLLYKMVKFSVLKHGFQRHWNIVYWRSWAKTYPICIFHLVQGHAFVITRMKRKYTYFLFIFNILFRNLNELSKAKPILKTL